MASQKVEGSIPTNSIAVINFFLNVNFTTVLRNHVDLHYGRYLNTRTVNTVPVALSTPEYLNRFRFGFTLFPMMWIVKNGFDADPFYLDRKAVRRVVSIRV